MLTLNVPNSFSSHTPLWPQTHHLPVSFVCIINVIFLKCEEVLPDGRSTNTSNLVEQSHSFAIGEASGHLVAVTTSTPEAQVGGSQVDALL